MSLFLIIGLILGFNSILKEQKYRNGNELKDTHEFRYLCSEFI